MILIYKLGEIKQSYNYTTTCLIIAATISIHKQQLKWCGSHEVVTAECRQDPSELTKIPKWITTWREPAWLALAAHLPNGRRIKQDLDPLATWGQRSLWVGGNHRVVHTFQYRFPLYVEFCYYFGWSIHPFKLLIPKTGYEPWHHIIPFMGNNLGEINGAFSA